MAEALITTLQDAMSYENGIQGVLRDMETACARQYAHWRDDLGFAGTSELAYWQRCWDVIAAARTAAAQVHTTA